MTTEIIVACALSFLAGYFVAYVAGWGRSALPRAEFEAQGPMDIDMAKNAVRRLFPDAEKSMFIEAKGDTEWLDNAKCQVTVNGDLNGSGDDWQEAILDLLDRSSHEAYRDK